MTKLEINWQHSDLKYRPEQHQLSNANIDRKCGQDFTQRSKIVVIVKSTHIL